MRFAISGRRQISEAPPTFGGALLHGFARRPRYRYGLDHIRIKRTFLNTRKAALFGSATADLCVAFFFFPLFSLLTPSFFFFLLLEQQRSNSPPTRCVVLSGSRTPYRRLLQVNRSGRVTSHPFPPSMLHTIRSRTVSNLSRDISFFRSRHRFFFWYRQIFYVSFPPPQTYLPISVGLLHHLHSIATGRIGGGEPPPHSTQQIATVPLRPGLRQSRTFHCFGRLTPSPPSNSRPPHANLENKIWRRNLRPAVRYGRTWD